MTGYYYQHHNKGHKTKKRLIVFLVLFLSLVILSVLAVFQQIRLAAMQNNLESLENRFQKVEQENNMLWEQYDSIKKENEKLREENYMLRSSTLIFHGNRHTNKVAITIDDGASQELIAQFLERLQEFDLKVTLFPIGHWLETNPEIWHRAVQEGHELGNHTYSHAFLEGLTDDEIRKELSRWQDTVEQALGYSYRTLYFRPPEMSGFTDDNPNRTSYMEVVAKKGMFTVLWDVEIFYALRNETITPTRTIEHVLNNARGGSIVLLHFNHNDLAALPHIITGLRNRGLVPCSLRELLLAKP